VASEQLRCLAIKLPQPRGVFFLSDAATSHMASLSRSISSSTPARLVTPGNRTSGSTTREIVGQNSGLSFHLVLNNSEQSPFRISQREPFDRTIVLHFGHRVCITGIPLCRARYTPTLTRALQADIEPVGNPHSFFEYPAWCAFAVARPAASMVPDGPARFRFPARGCFAVYAQKFTTAVRRSH